MTGPGLPEIRRVGIVGCGVMGSGIAEVCARSGADVLVAVSSPSSEAAGRRRVHASLDRALRKEKITESERESVLARLAFTTALADLHDRQLVIESIHEDEAAKTDLFVALDRIVDDSDAILASNTSSIPIMRLARVTSRPDQVIGLHFFNPAPAMPLVELAASIASDEKVCARAESFVTGELGKTVIRVGDRTGFVVNALLVPYLLAAIRMVESGFATAETVDKGMVLGCAHPVGPLELADRIGLDTIAAVARSLYGELKEPRYAPPPLLIRMIEAGRLGRKCGHGFYRYE